MRYALIENGIVTNVIEAAEDYIAPFGEAIATDEAGIGWTYQNGQWQEPALEEQPVTFAPITPRQLRLALRQLGKLQDVPIILTSLPSPQREDAEIEWEYATQFLRDHPLIIQLSSILGLSEEQVNDFWLQAANL